MDWVLEHRPNRPSIFLPEGLDRSSLTEISTLADSFAIFIDVHGRIHDGKEYVKMAVAELDKEVP